MNPVLIAEIISGAAQFMKTVAPLVEDAANTLQSSDAAKVHAALAELQAASDALHASVQAKLRGTI